MLRNICYLSWDHKPKQRVSMSFIAASLRDFGRGRSMSRPLCGVDSNGGDIKRHRGMSSESFQSFSGYALAQGIKEDQLYRNRSLICLSICLEQFFSRVDSKSEVRLRYIKWICNG